MLSLLKYCMKAELIMPKTPLQDRQRLEILTKYKSVSITHLEMQAVHVLIFH